MNKVLIIIKVTIIALLICSLHACATKPVPFELAIQNLAKNLLREVQIKSLLSTSKAKKLVLDDFTDEDTGEVIAVSKQIEDIIISEVEKNYPNYSLSKINSNNIKYANYVINGIISLESHKKNMPEKYYHVFASATNLETGKIIAKSSAWVSTRNLDYTPLREYRNAPMYLTDSRHDSKIINARGTSNVQQNSEYYDSIDTSALLNEASEAYGMGQYDRGIMLFKKAADRTDGQIMKTYAGLYQSYMKVGDESAAEDAFGKLVELSVLNNSLNVKLLFKVNSTDFVSDHSLSSRYGIWLRQISHFFNNNNYCAYIVGHSSHTGGVEYNKRLSKARAEAVRQLMSTYVSGVRNKTDVIGKGFSENIKGLGTDDGRDAIDRRVEFRIVDCGRGNRIN